MKRKIVFEVIIDNDSAKCMAEYHPRGYMRAKHDHLDIGPECKVLNTLFVLAKNRGVSLKCLNRNGCLSIIVPEINYEALICIQNYRVKCRNRIYLMITRRGNLYIPVTLIKA
ncbi:hypothetical protein [Staphylothermus hellenicus]|uniref:Uncharacterized protein n=1 Tax=Staphylothermus hellenicus (strain DSM 12710 / JCM 10830 / BK20S6-10-b1 / P8) TaxID=591019 RepID=D7DBL3_STAHD|nr:hypothetical protein [Staphylothermus hellenicus]ADI31560.1 hypothetical protein Shell_0429 [Staphylothermus hellenicus DSM 12710]